MAVLRWKNGNFLLNINILLSFLLLLCMLINDLNDFVILNRLFLGGGDFVISVHGLQMKNNFLSAMFMNVCCPC